ncbi:MAG: recombination protein RecR [Erysipelotrichaceae bacterium]|nr:recombination protein RecR [Erysipelotrichaceae bacterium]
MELPVSFENVIDALKKLPGIGRKSAEKLAFQLLELDKESQEKLVSSLTDMMKNIKICEKCGMISEEQFCKICNDATRDKSKICVVENIKDVFALERTKEYDGLYHVLGGVISPNKGIMPEDLNIKTLEERITSETKEIILANSTGLEGETTSLFLNKLLSKYDLTITRLGYGIPMGAQLDYADEFTLIKALESRKKV